MPAASSPFQVSREQRRDMLTRHFVGAVEELLEEHDESGRARTYGELSVERIITAGAISRSTFYSYFDDKNDLLEAMATDVIAELVGTGASWWQLEPGATKEQLHDGLRPPLDTYRAHRAILGSVVEVATYDARIRAQQRWLVDNVVDSLTTHLRRWQDAGAVDPARDAARTAQWIIWMLERGLYQLVGPADGPEVDRQLAALTDVVWAALYA
ncbi:TetR/AcrR family transcriptional regulator [Actinomycetospora endophytica]|uniref:TetR/AcrR family transcriptional regulator n=1 Tax=Actinomycetospora endophytica TaxID=2291215 RepID=A0ABS8P904_9PSEU|nr:TetR/AcrR family transcriptional regulator [Actinomycetospora endophytica]MCD2194718.1 TetR/AcrR family transcriptional regulator [Actinomycetospora endophytica]